jgi:uncharacterized membrane protein YeaQ/YmgE (transglycosylase-associated protein family)
MDAAFVQNHLFIVLLLIGIIAGLIYETVSNSEPGYIISALVGIAGSCIGYSLVLYIFVVTDIQWHATPIRLIGAVVGAIVVQWASRTIKPRGIWRP